MSVSEPMTPRGYDELIKEFNYLKDIEKPRVNLEKQRAAELGDRSENAEYHAAKEKLRHIDKRLFYLNSMIQKSQIIDPAECDHSRVHFGSSVTIVDLDSDDEFCYTLCGVLESETENSLISIHSPIAKAMIGKQIGDQFHIKLPSGAKDYEIVNIECFDLYSLKKSIKNRKRLRV